MKKYLLVIIFIFPLFNAHSQDKNGVVISSLDHTAIEGAHVLNISNKNMAISNADGKFFLQITGGDTLVISNINFNTKQLIVPNSTFLAIEYLFTHQKAIFMIYQRGLYHSTLLI